MVWDLPRQQMPEATLAAGPAATGGSIGAARVLWAVFDGGQPGSEEVARLAVGGGSAVVEPSGGEIVAE